MAKNKPYLVNLGRKKYYTKPRPQIITYKRTDEKKYPTYKNTREISIKKLLTQLSKNAFELRRAINTDAEFQRLYKLKNTLELLENVILYTKPELKKK